jgi:Fe-S cluster assembly iron-binding protein IscA
MSGYNVRLEDWRMLKITESAHAELARFHKEELFDGEFIRIARAYQCGGPRFQLTVDETRTSMDQTIEFSDFELVIENSCLELLKDCELDYAETGFIFIDPLGNVC